MKRTMIAALFAATLLTVPACTTMSNENMASADRQETTFTHRHRHSHKGMPKHHDGTYHGVTRVHEHTHTR